MNETQEKTKFDFGAVAGSVIIIVLLLLAGWYFYNELEMINNDLDDVNRAGTIIPREESTPESVEEDLSNNPFDAIEEELDDIDAEYEAEAEAQAQAEADNQ